MAIDQDRVKLETRLLAIEHALSQIHAASTLSLSDDQFQRMMQSWRDQMARETFPGIDSAISDLLAGEALEAMERLLTRTHQYRDQMQHSRHR